MADRLLRDLIDLVLESIDEPAADGRALARRANFSRDHLDRLLAAATGESPVALRRRLLLERAAWQLRTGAATSSEAAAAAGYGSVAAFSRAFARAHGEPPSAFAGSDRPLELDAPNGIHFHPPAGLLIPGAREPVGRGDLTERMVSHHLDRVRDLRRRFERAARAFARLARSIRDRGAWDDAFVDALCEPPQSFTYGGVLAHVLAYGAIRREALAAVLAELGADVRSSGDPIEWEAGR